MPKSMMAILSEANRRVMELERRRSVAARRHDLTRYAGRYRDYCRQVLRFDPTDAQEQLVGGMFRPPFRSLGRAGHGVGKSRAVASAVSFIYDTLDPSMSITTAPREESVKNIVWRELHDMRTKAGLLDFKSDVSLELRSSPQHFAIGMTAKDAYSFHGKHLLRNFFFLDEAEGIKPEFWAAAQSMMMGEQYGMLAIYNPYSTSCQAYQEEISGNCNLTVISCLDHPNIGLQLAGKPPLIPSAVNLAWIMSELKLYSEVVSEQEADDQCFQFPPPKSHKSVLAEYPSRWWRITPHIAIRVFGRWPPEGADTVWNEAMFKKCRENHKEIQPQWRTAIGCDVARFGDDLTEMVVRRGPCVVHMEAHSGWSASKTCGRLKQLAYEFRGPEDQRQVRVYVDEPGMGGAGVVDYADGFNFIGINPSWGLRDVPGEHCYNVRAKLWLDGKIIAKDGLMDLSRLTAEQAKELQRQLLVQTYDFKLGTEKIFLTEKSKIKELIKRSPDTADALNLCFCQVDVPTETIAGSLA